MDMHIVSPQPASLPEVCGEPGLPGNESAYLETQQKNFSPSLYSLWYNGGRLAPLGRSHTAMACCPRPTATPGVP